MSDEKQMGSWRLAVDYGPLVLFFLAYKLSNVFIGTAIFMGAIIVALVFSKWKLGRISPMLWLSAILIIGFGALTIWFHDAKFIQMKPTIIYLLLGGLLFGGVMLGKPLLKYVLEVGYDGLSDRGWLALSRNWGLFFLAMAAINEVLRRALDFDQWLTVKVWGLPLLSIAFAFTQVPLLMRYGLGSDQSPPVPPEA